MSPSESYDVVVLGGGPAGCATALALARRGVTRVLVVEANSRAATRVGECLPPDTRLLLERLGVWEDFRAQGHEACLGSCSSWGSDELGYNDFLFNPHGNGWHLDRRRFDALLARKAEESGAELRVGTRFHGAERIGKHGFELRLEATEGPARAVRARFVVDATGCRSRFARAMGARPLLHDRLSYVVAFFELAADSTFPRLTILEAVEYGWWYAARLPGGRLVTTLACDPEFVKRGASNTEEGWLALLRGTDHLSEKVAHCEFANLMRFVCSSPSFLLDKANGDDWLAVGDAASAFDPILSQGIHKSLLDGLRAAEAIVAALRGDPRGLGQYHASIADRFANYLKVRKYFYGSEWRWPSAPFWGRRRERVACG